MSIERLIRAAQEQELPELVLKNGKIVNVFTGEILDGDIAITDGVIAGVGEYHGQREIDLKGRYVTPGFVNAHVHVESSMVTPQVYAMEELKFGVTTIITDPHEIANVAGTMALREMIRAAKTCPINYYIMLPSCVPATPFEHSGAVLNAKELAEFRSEEIVLGLGEMMNSVGVIRQSPDVMEKLKAFSDMIIDGHAPMVTGKELNAYVCGGIQTDHESVSYEEAVEKLRCGMAVLVREGSASKNLEAIIRGVIDHHISAARMAFCTDDKHLGDIVREGTIRSILQKAVSLGLPPVEAVRMASYNAASIYRLKGIGAVACGYRADLVVLEDLKDFKVCDVYKDGRPIAEIPSPEPLTYDEALPHSVHLAPLREDAFRIPEQETYDVIGLVSNQIVTRRISMTHEQVQKGLRDGTVRKIAVIERHHATGHYACAYLTGYGLQHGAIGTTVAHDSHNLIVLGDNDADMLKAVEELNRINGGYTIVVDGQAAASLPLELAGLMSMKPADEFIESFETINALAYELGVEKEIDPFITLSFIALPVIPEIRLTDCGLFDVTKFTFLT